MNITEDQILLLAPDEASKKAGKELANPSKWVTKGANDQVLWGECQGSGSKPYQTQVDLINIAFKCSCPSRKFPCKHGVALGLLYARQPKTFTESKMPPWVEEWIHKRTEKEEKKTEKKEKPVNEESQAKRKLAREQKVADGIEELLIWIKDIVRNGITHIPDKPYAYWNSIAKRMIDAQSPGLAGMIKSFAGINYFKEGWQSTFMDNLLNIYLIARGYQNKETLDPLLFMDIKSLIGFSISQDELKEQKGISDTWLILGKQVSVEDTITVEKNWLYGIKSNRYALVLQFIVRGQTTSILLSPGLFIEAELVYYSSVSPLRALIKQQKVTQAIMPETPFQSWNEVSEMETMICSMLPVRSERPYVVKQLLPVHYNNSWWLKDSYNNLIGIKDGFSGIWKLLALSGGSPLNTAVIGKENTYEPIGVWDNQIYKVI